MDEMFSILQSSPRAPFEDLEKCRQRIMSLDLTSQDRMKWVMQAQGFQEWLNQPKSYPLLINGNMDGNEVFSPTTLVCAQLLNSLQQILSVVTLHFFCSLHQNTRDGIEANATGIVRNLVMQLLMKEQAWDLQFLEEKDLDKLDEGDIDTLTTVLFELMLQLPVKTFVFLIIDGVTWYERSEKRQDFMQLIGDLLSMIEHLPNAVVKLLLTCHGKSSFVKNCLPAQQILTVPPKIDGGRQGWNKRTEDLNTKQTLYETGIISSALDQ